MVLQVCRTCLPPTGFRTTPGPDCTHIQFREPWFYWGMACSCGAPRGRPQSLSLFLSLQQRAAPKGSSPLSADAAEAIAVLDAVIADLDVDKHDVDFDGEHVPGVGGWLGEAGLTGGPYGAPHPDPRKTPLQAGPGA